VSGSRHLELFEDRHLLHIDVRVTGAGEAYAASIRVSEESDRSRLATFSAQQAGNKSGFFRQGDYYARTKPVNKLLSGSGSNLDLIHGQGKMAPRMNGNPERPGK
jgi:hypothetical protein